MATITITIAGDGTPAPPYITINEGDTVRFQAEADAVLCVDPESVFGAERFEIPANSAVDLLVQTSPSGGFQYLTKMGDLGAACGGDRDKNEGGGGGPG